jgi:hypothetical protein
VGTNGHVQAIWKLEAGWLKAPALNARLARLRRRRDEGAGSFKFWTEADGDVGQDGLENDGGWWDEPACVVGVHRHLDSWVRVT